MSVAVVSVANRIPDRAKEPYYRFSTYVDSLARFGEAPIVLGMNEPWGGLMTKPRRLRQWLRNGSCTADTLIVADAFDVVFTTSAADVEKKYRELWPGLPLVFNSERAIFPRPELAYAFEDVPGPWRYLNSGFMIGEPATILALLEAMWLDDVHDDYRSPDDLHGGAGTMINTNDQSHFLYAYAAQPVSMALDHQCQLCQTLSGCSLDEFELSGPRLQNIATGSYPLVWHFNGGSKDILLPAFLRKWGME